MIRGCSRRRGRGLDEVLFAVRRGERGLNLLKMPAGLDRAGGRIFYRRVRGRKGGRRWEEREVNFLIMGTACGIRRASDFFREMREFPSSLGLSGSLLDRAS